jgi:glutamate dehydrogenase
MKGVTKSYLDFLTERFTESGISKEMGRRIAITRAIYTSLNITEVATLHRFDLIKTAKVYFDVGGRFGLVWFRDQIANDNSEGHWNTLARLTLRDELDILQKNLTYAIIKNNKKETNSHRLIEQWVNKNKYAIDRWEKVLEMIFASATTDYSMFFIAIRELSNWVNDNEIAGV